MSPSYGLLRETRGARSCDISPSVGGAGAKDVRRASPPSGRMDSCGILDDRLMVRVPPDQHEQISSEAHVKVMDFIGRSMRGFKQGRDSSAAASAPH